MGNQHDVLRQLNFRREPDCIPISPVLTASCLRVFFSLSFVFLNLTCTGFFFFFFYSHITIPCSVVTATRRCKEEISDILQSRRRSFSTFLVFLPRLVFPPLLHVETFRDCRRLRGVQ